VHAKIGDSFYEVISAIDSLEIIYECHIQGINRQCRYTTALKLLFGKFVISTHLMYIGVYPHSRVLKIVNSKYLMSLSLDLHTPHMVGYTKPHIRWHAGLDPIL